MKKLLILSCALAFCLALAACHTTDSADSSVSSGSPSSAIANESTAHQTEPESSLEESRTSRNTAVTSDPTESETTAPAKPANSESTTKPESEKTTESTTPPQTEPETKPTEPPSESAKAYAGAEDTRAVADKVLEYINSFRTSSAVKLPGLTSYAEYRSRQLIRNFAHDTNDERAAATALQYGEYVDPSVYGGSGEPYYRANANEAIAKAGYVGTVDEVAYRLATLVRNSAEHWCYIGSAEYGYIAVGVTYESGMWYCDIAVAAENTDNL